MYKVKKYGCNSSNEAKCVANHFFEQNNGKIKLISFEPIKVKIDGEVFKK